MRLERRVHVGGFRVVVVIDAAHLAHELQPMLHRAKAADRPRDIGQLRACEPARARRRHRVLDVVPPADRNLAGLHQQFAVEQYAPVLEPHARRDRPREAEPKRLAARRRAVSDASRVVGVQHGVVVLPLRLEQTPLGGGVIFVSMVPVEMIRRHIQAHGDIGAEVVNRFELEAR